MIILYVIISPGAPANALLQIPVNGGEMITHCMIISPLGDKSACNRLFGNDL